MDHILIFISIYFGISIRIDVSVNISNIRSNINNILSIFVFQGETILGSPESKETDGLCVTIPLICRYSVLCCIVFYSIVLRDSVRKQQIAYA